MVPIDAHLGAPDAPQMGRPCSGLSLGEEGTKGFQGRRIPQASTSLRLGEEALGTAVVQMTVPQPPCQPITIPISIPGRMGGCQG